MPHIPSPKQSEKDESRERLNRSLKVAVEEADRDGYVSAKDGRKRIGEVLKRIDQQTAAGRIKP